MTNWRYESRESPICHRIGYRAFVIYGSDQWRWLHEVVCARRNSQRSLSGSR